MLKPSLWLFALAACGASTNGIDVTLSPDVVSSLDGTLQVHATVFADKDVMKDKSVDFTVDYTDRNGTAHSIDPVTVKTDVRGEADATISGLTWDGTGTVTAAVTGTKVSGDATFAVLDRTPPKVTITAPATAHAQTDVNVMIQATDEIGVSEVDFETSQSEQFGGRGRATTIASGALDTTVQFTFTIPQGVNVGTTITLYALAVDLSGNIGVAPTVTVTVN